MEIRKLFSKPGDIFPMHKPLLALACLLASTGFAACGGAAGPFDMTTTATMFVGGADSAPDLAFIVDPEEQGATGDLLAEIDTEFPDRFQLTLTSLTLTFNFANVGTVTVTLDPNNPSTATIFKVTANGNPEGTHVMNLNLVIATPDQNLVLTGVSLSTETSLLQLDESLPSLGFFFQNQPMELDLSSLNVSIPPALITPDTSNQ